MAEKTIEEMRNEMRDALEEEAKIYMAETLPQIIQATMGNEIVKKQMEQQERIAAALERLVELKAIEVKNTNK